MIKNQIHYLSKDESTNLVNSIKSTRHQLITLLMLDAGLRVSEACSIQLGNFDFKKRIITIRSLKKRGKNSFRQIPISSRLYNLLGIYLEKSRIDLKNPTNFLFPSYSLSGHISRKAVWKQLKRQSKNLAIQNLHPHTLRHTFATHHLSSGTQLAEIKEMLGHSSYDTTLIYASIPLETLKQKVEKATAKKQSLYDKILAKLFQEKPQKLINIDFSQNYFSIGRNDELKQISSLAEKGVNTILVGPIGVGKSHLLQNATINKKVLRLDDTENIKKSLAQILLYLYKGDKKSVLDLIWQSFTIEEIQKKIQRENTIQLCDTITAVLQPKEYILIIDDITRITPSGRKAIERLKNTFTILCSAREIKANDTAFLWDFEVIKIKNLNRNYALQLIKQLSTSLEVENLEVFYNHILEQSDGNPRAIAELIERYKKEPFLTVEVIKEIRHTGALPEWDFTFIVVIFLGFLTIMRYASSELDEPALRMIGSIGLLFLLLSRPLFRYFKRSTI